MNNQPKIDCIEQRVERTIASFNHKRHSNRRKAFSFKMIGIIGGATVTILLGLKSISNDYSDIIKDIAFSLSVLITAAASIDAFFDHRSLWIRYTQTVNHLWELNDRIKYMKTTEHDQDDIDRVFEEYGNILRKNNDYWIELRNERKNTEATRR